MVVLAAASGAQHDSFLELKEIFVLIFFFEISILFYCIQLSVELPFDKTKENIYVRADRPTDRLPASQSVSQVSQNLWPVK